MAKVPENIKYEGQVDEKPIISKAIEFWIFAPPGKAEAIMRDVLDLVGKRTEAGEVHDFQIVMHRNNYIVRTIDSDGVPRS